jgi:hypothetical protein
VPSEHTQNGKRYDAELQMYSFYSVNASVAEVPNQMGSVSIFLEAYDGVEDWPILNKIICQWRQVEEDNRAQCGIKSVYTQYSGCPKFNRTSRRERNLRKAKTAYDVMREADEAADLPTIEQDNWQEPDTEWNDFIQQYLQQNQRGQEDTDLDRDLAQLSSTNDYFNLSQWVQPAANLSWFNFFGLPEVKTEYYFRYSG